MNFHIFCIFIVTLLCTVSSSADSSDGNKCVQEYLRQKGKLGAEFPAVEWSPRCRLIATSAMTILNESIKSRIKSGMPVLSVSCLIEEFTNQEIVDVILKLQVVKKSELSENQKQSLTSETYEEFKNDLASVANKCEADQNKFFELFLDFFGSKRPHNKTLSAMEHNYCFAKYAAENDLLPLKNVELNPDGIDTRNVNCTAIIQEEQARQEQELRQKLIIQKPSVVECILDGYRNQNLFQSQVSTMVLNFLDLPKDIEEAETEKLKATFARVPLISFLCTVADTSESS